MSIPAVSRLRSSASRWYGSLPVRDSEQLVGIIAYYTSKLAEANSVELSGLANADSEAPTDVIVDMRRCLMAKQQIFDEAA